MKPAAPLTVAVTTPTALGATPVPVVARTMLDDGRGQLAGVGDLVRGISNIFSNFHSSAFLPLPDRSAELAHYLDKILTFLLQSPFKDLHQIGLPHVDNLQGSPYLKVRKNSRLPAQRYPPGGYEAGHEVPLCRSWS